jgi:hypothetical protein
VVDTLDVVPYSDGIGPHQFRQWSIFHCVWMARFMSWTNRSPRLRCSRRSKGAE